MTFATLVVMTRWLDPNEQRAWRAFVQASGAVTGLLDDALQEQQALTMGEYGVLAALSEADDHRLRMCDLAELLRLTPSGLTRRLDPLVKRGYISRVHGTTDRRVVYAELTPAGLTKLKEAAPSHVEAVRRLFIDRLSAPQLRQLTTILETLGACDSSRVAG